MDREQDAHLELEEKGGATDARFVETLLHALRRDLSNRRRRRGGEQGWGNGRKDKALEGVQPAQQEEER